MSSTCNIVGCRNDVRYKERQIIMPHVRVFRFHTPRQEHMQQWQTKLNLGRDQKKDGYTVSRNTRVCSNHFRNGRYCKQTCAAPTIYLQKYPDWAKSSADLQKAAAVLDDAIVCQVLAHVLQCLTEKEKLDVCECISMSTVDNIFEVVKIMNKDIARDLLSQVNRKRFPIGKLQEAIAMYNSGIEFDSVGLLRQNVTPATAHSESSLPSPLPASRSEPVLNEQSPRVGGAGHEEQSNCTPYSTDSWHNYAIPHNKDVATVHHNHPATCTVTTSDHGVRSCHRVKCKKEKDALRKKIRLLNQRIELLTHDVRTVTDERNKAEEEVKVLKNRNLTLSQNRGQLSMEEISVCYTLTNLKESVVHDHH